MNAKRKQIVYISLTVVVLLVIAAVMMIIGRGHTIYFDNKTLEYEGESYSYAHRVIVRVNGEQVAKLSKKERGMATNMGQSFSFDIEVTPEKGADAQSYSYNIKLPYSLDGVVLNLPGMIAGLPEEAYMSEFVPIAYVEPDEPEADETDEFGLGGDL